MKRDGWIQTRILGGWIPGIKDPGYKGLLGDALISSTDVLFPFAHSYMFVPLLPTMSATWLLSSYPNLPREIISRQSY